ncbi:methyltransferase domain-containing protein [Paraburkholderia sp. RL17-347-BIC-D]|uniref:methyltransferase domain-containing protein n=1 Tax=Paraburkholderia sp. RL17-347-BIC-D TaxID=3031632 RepID=UPI0038B89E6D
MQSKKYHEYDNQFVHTNVYGHAFDLLVRNRSSSQVGTEVIHLDIGCGFGRIAEPLVEANDISYVGVDLEESGLVSLRERGFEAHRVDLNDKDLADNLLSIVGNRKIASISLLDTLEHLSNGDHVLSVLSDLAAQYKALVVISVPNVAHRDIGFKLAFGRWDYTAAGLLDYTHVRLFSAQVLDRVLRHAGLHSVAQYHVRATKSDQAFPSSHPALANGTMLNGLLQSMRSKVDDNADVNQFVHACLAGPKVANDIYVERKEDRPFLSIVTRTQGKRIHCLEELGVTLAGQSCIDFEWIITGHHLNVERQIAVEQVIEDLPKWLRDKTRLLLVNDGNRTRPLNEGFSAASGHYISIMDDDDVPLGHWVETFRKMAESKPGCLLRAAPVRQEAETVLINGVQGLRSTSSFDKCFPSEFQLFDHLRVNRTPNMALAFPRGVFHDLHIKFDETLTTTEDWDFIMRVAGVVGVASSPTITSVYRWWGAEHSSRTDHPQEEWELNYQRILQKMDSEMVLFPVGTARRIREICDARDAAQGSASPGSSIALQKLFEVRDLLHSTSWRATAFVRVLRRLTGARPISLGACLGMTAEQLEGVKRAILSSRSWRIARPLRAIKLMLTAKR